MATLGQEIQATFNPANPEEFDAKAMGYAGQSGTWVYSFVVNNHFTDNKYAGEWAMSPKGQPQCPFRWCLERDLRKHDANA